MMSLWSMVAIAYCMDMFFGDPQWFPHPVRGIGWIITNFENLLRKKISNEKIAGGVLVFFVVMGVWSFSSLVLVILAGINYLFFYISSVVLIYTTLAAKDLAVQGLDIYRALEKGDIEAARNKLSMIVGRDTQNLTRPEIIRATIETVSENMVDGIIAPLFYAFLGGAPLALAYKAVNTLDSMVGYKNEHYKNFGFFAAKIDDIVNFIPARITAVILPVAVMLVGENGMRAAKVILRDRKKHPSPNSGIPEAGVAGALNIQLGGPSYYGGVFSKKPLIGDAINILKIQHIKDSVAINYICSLIVLVLAIMIMQ